MHINCQFSTDMNVPAASGGPIFCLVTKDRGEKDTQGEALKRLLSYCLYDRNAAPRNPNRPPLVSCCGARRSLRFACDLPTAATPFCSLLPAPPALANVPPPGVVVPAVLFVSFINHFFLHLSLHPGVLCRRRWQLGREEGFSSTWQPIPQIILSWRSRTITVNCQL